MEAKLAHEMHDQVSDLAHAGSLDPNGMGSTYHQYATDPLLVCALDSIGCTFANVHSAVMATQVPGYKEIQRTMECILFAKLYWGTSCTTYYGYITTTIAVTNGGIYRSTFGKAAN